MGSEALNSVGKAFKRLDKNNDGKLGFNEFSLIFVKLNAGMSNADLRDLYAAVDVDGSGSIDWSEFVQYISQGDIPLPLSTFISCFPCRGKDVKDRQKRANLWNVFDPNGNGFVSLAEADGAIEKVLRDKFGEDQGLALWKRYRPAYIRAFNDAKDVVKQRPIEGARADTDDYVTKREFRLFISFLAYYCTWFEVFSLIDGNTVGTTAEDDRRVSSQEWAIGVGKVQKVSSTWASFVALQDASNDSFGAIDTDGKGMILLREFCAWVKKAEIDNGTVVGARLEIDEDDTKEEKEQEQCNRAWKSYKDQNSADPTPEKMSGQLKEFLSVFNCGEQGNPDHKMARKKLWRRLDPNGNGHLSLAEVDAGIRATLWGPLGEDKGTYLWRRFRPAYIRAFNDAKDIAKQKPIPGVNADTDDYVTKREFRLLVCYLRYYCTWFEVFSLVDGNSDGTTAEDDRKISTQEWSAAKSKILGAGNSWAPFVALRETTGAGWGKGTVVLHEFCDWIKQREVEAGTPQGKQLDMGEEDEEEGVADAMQHCQTMGKSAVKAGPTSLSTFLGCFPCWEKGAGDREKRANLWNVFDPNGNSYVSLAEADAAIEKVLRAKLGEDQGLVLWKRYRPAYIRAFNDAKDIAKQRPIQGARADTDDYVTKREFRLFVCFLAYYCTWFEVFSLIDGNTAGTTAEDDRRVSPEEWAASIDKVNAASSTWAQFVALQSVAPETFSAIDADGKGMILLREFCAWVKKAEIDNGTVAGGRLEIDEEDVEEEKEQETCNRAWKSYKDQGMADPTPEKMSGQLKEFLSVFNCGEKGNPEQMQARKKLWTRFDPNGNGYISLAEVDAGIRATLWGRVGEDKGTYLWRRFRPAYIRAFNDGKDTAKMQAISGANADTDDYVTRWEFRLLVCYLRYYCTWFEVFSLVDGNSDGTTAEDDRRISTQEWSAAKNKVLGAGNSWAPFVALRETTGAGWGKDTVVLHEFCDWIKQREVEAGTPQGAQLSIGEEDDQEGDPR